MGNGLESRKVKAIGLRKRGLSYGEIRKELDISKSTLSFWLKGIVLKPEHKKRLYTKQIAILSRGAPSQKERRAREVEEIIKNAGSEIEIPLSVEAHRLMGAALYWAEGSKGKMFQLTNSDPHMILFVVRWIQTIFGIYPSGLRARLNIYPQQNDSEIKRFWSDLTGIPVKNFGKSYVKPLSKGYKKNNLYYGTMRIEMPKSVNIRYRVFGWIQAVLKSIGPDVAAAQRRWQSLAKTERPVNL